ncbi:radical SAM protein [bacterium]|nr:radical SAM protein [bacterium]
MSPSPSPHSDWSPAQVAAAAQAIVQPAAITALLEHSTGASAADVRDILFEAGHCRGLTLPQAATLLQVTDPPLRERITTTARVVHERMFARRVRLSDPVCPTNRCVNDCLYCPLRRSNTHLRRHTTGPRDLQREVIPLLEEGHRHLTLVFGDSRTGIQYVRDVVDAVYALRSRTGRVQRVDVNLNSSGPEELAALAGVERLGTYHLYQETYHPETYARLHPEGPKADFAWRLTSHDRAAEAGLRDLGLGVLLGVYDPCFDVLALLTHAHVLVTTGRARSVTVSYPRLLATPVAPASAETTWAVDDDSFAFLVAVTRLALPRTEIILNTPAPSEVRRTLYAQGVSQVSVGSSSYPGVYSADGAPEAGGRLTIGRPRNLETLVYRMCEVGFVPDFCAVSGAGPEPPADAGPDAARLALDHKAANSLLALKEYLLDYASEDTQTIAAGIIQEELARLSKKVRNQTLELMEEAEAGFRGQRL